MYSLLLSDIRYFNPRPHAGATVVHLLQVSGYQISIHAPMRGRLQIDDPVQQQRAISIHAPMRGRLYANIARAMWRIFQSTPPCGGDLTKS